MLRADTTDANCTYTAESMSRPRKEESTRDNAFAQEEESNAEPSVPEDVGREAAARLLDEIYRGTVAVFLIL